MLMLGWSTTRRRLWRWGWISLMAAVWFMPLGMSGSCADSATGAGQCSTSYTPLMGYALGYSIPAP